MEDRLKSIKRKLNFTRVISFICTIFPVIVYLLIGLFNGEVQKTKKVVLGMTLVIAIILVLVNVLMKYHLRSPIFILLIGIHLALDKIVTLLILISIGIIIDEFFLQPIIKNLKIKVGIRKELEYGKEE